MSGRYEWDEERFGPYPYPEELEPEPKRKKPQARTSDLGQALDATELDSLPDAEPIIEGWLERGTVVVAAGDTGTYKTFLLFGWACCLATGTDWMGYPVYGKHKVLYIAGEGGRGLKYRLRAWQEANGIDVPRGMLKVRLMPKAEINTLEFWQALALHVRETKPTLIIMDTFSSLAPSADEVADAAGVIRAGMKVAAMIDGAVVIAAHTGWGDKKRIRGGSQWESNADTVIITSRTVPADEDEDNSAPREIWRKKDKDGPSNLREYVALAVADGDKSGVLERTERPNVMGADVKALRLVESDPGKTASAYFPNGGNPKAAFNRSVDRLVDRGILCLHPAKPRGQSVHPIGTCPDTDWHVRKHGISGEAVD